LFGLSVGTPTIVGTTWKLCDTQLQALLQPPRNKSATGSLPEIAK